MLATHANLPRGGCSLPLPTQEKSCTFSDCSYGTNLIKDYKDVKCKYSECTESECCEKVCADYDCPHYYTLVDDSDSTACKDSKCTTDVCCEKGEIFSS